MFWARRVMLAMEKIPQSNELVCWGQFSELSDKVQSEIHASASSSGKVSWYLSLR